ncbi:MAG TPA: class II aldolase/adducin family protein, partial [Candidatus Fraserbacteria bacterium]|nr:class II aldolase/adducin family protein [Candidatus Fraserbacteria bacterium]
MKSDRQLRLEVAWACRILAMEGHNDLTLGHVSARAADGQTVYIKRLGLGLDEVMAKDVISIDLDGQLISGAGSVHLEFPLHTEVY